MFLGYMECEYMVLPQKYLDGIVARIKGFMMRQDRCRPVYLGAIADDIGWSLERTKEFMSLTLFKPASLEKKREFDVPEPELADMYTW